MQVYDFGLIWSSGLKQKFVRTIKSECNLRRLKLLFISDRNAKKIIEDLARGRLKIGFLFDTEADYTSPKDTLARLRYTAKNPAPTWSATLMMPGRPPTKL